LIESRDKQTLNNFLKKYQNFPLKVIEHSKSFWSVGYVIFCCNTLLFKQIFAEYDRAQELYKQFLLDDQADTFDGSLIRCAISFFNRFREEDDSEYCYAIFDNSVHAAINIKSKYENVFKDQYILKCSKKPKIFIFCDQVLHNQINFYHFVCFLVSVMDKRPLEDFAFVFPNNPKEKELYQRLVKCLKGN